MAFFKKNDSFRDLVAKLERPGQMGPTELAETLEAVLSHPDASLRRLSFMLHSPHPRIRDAGIELVRRSTGPEAVQVLALAVQSVEGTARVELARQMLALDRAETLRAMSALFHGPRPEARSVVLDVAAIDPVWRDWLPILRQALKVPDAPLRRQAARALRRRADDPTVRAVLRDLLHDDDGVVRAEAIHAFCERPDAEIVEPFFARLPHEGANEQARMIQALSELSRQPDTNVEAHLFPVLSDEQPQTRSLAVKLLGQMPGSDLVLRRFLVHCRGLASWLRDRAIQSILELAHDLAEPLVQLMHDADQDVRVQALTLAARLDDPRVVEPATRVFCSEADWWERSLAAEILGKFPSEAVLSILLPFVDDREMRYSVVSVLARLDRPESTAQLIECLADRARAIRSTALDGLAGRHHDEVIRAITMCARHDTEASIRTKALEVLRGFGDATTITVRAIEAEQQKRLEVRASELQADLQMVNDELNRG